MILFLLLVITEIMTYVTIQKHFRESSKTAYYISVTINSVLSIFMWMIYYRVVSFHGYYDDPRHVWMIMILNGALAAILFPRVLLNICHFSGVLIRIRKGGHIRQLTNAGFILSVVIFTIIIYGSTIGKLNFRTEEVSININDLKPDLEGLTIVQLSDLHMAGFYKHKSEFKKILERARSYKPDILINSGDFVSYGWREFERNDTLLSIPKGRYGNFAVMGNHDIGTYNPNWNAEQRDSNLYMMNLLVKGAGYSILNDKDTIIKIGQTEVAVIGVITRGRYPHMIHGDLEKAKVGSDSADFRILISHDPNHWEESVRGKTNIELTLSGHTHGMQMGILTKLVKWSPSVYFYPRWGGLYNSGDQYLYVTRGLGVLAIPFRIWMPPELTIIRLTSGQKK
jgi:uncharacterized protein